MENGDTLQGLAGLIGLLPGQALGENGWLKDESGEEIANEGQLVPGDKYGIPNLILSWKLSAKGLMESFQNGTIKTLHAQLEEDSTKLSQKGYSVLRITDGRVEQFTRILSRDYIAGLLYAGHGDSSALLALSHRDNSSGGELYNNVGPDDASPPYQLPVIHLYACSSAVMVDGALLGLDENDKPIYKQIGWADHYNNQGSFRGFTQEIDAFDFNAGHHRDYRGGFEAFLNSTR